MEKLYKRFVGLVTKWKTTSQADEFFAARLRLTFYYSATAIVILGGSSIVLYNTILSNLTDSIQANIFLDPHIAELIIDRAQDILLNRFLTIDIILIFFIVVLGFLLTHKTLAPIKSNMQKQKRFIADASHELRTPIAVIISGLEVNLDNKKLDFEGAKKTLENTLGEMRDFSKLSNNLLDLSKYDMPTETKYEPIDIGELINSIVEKNKSLASFKEITIEAKVKTGTIVSGNKIELSRVFYNILDNAIKYTPHNGKILISEKISLNNYILTISDNGNGIPKDIIAKIFDPFFRGDVSRSTEGAGLGLTLSKKIIENHKGTISIKSEENKGTNVIISLPLAS
ncbi:MAG: HAMP domain-containing sensor histidine kinase [Candidatus Pacebacteria bacterium]|nr:HAMP domain-containing sensor histidine kinase [Candidatus Paceibacterota bacterium]